MRDGTHPHSKTRVTGVPLIAATPEAFEDQTAVLGCDAGTSVRHCELD